MTRSLAKKIASRARLIATLFAVALYALVAAPFASAQTGAQDAAKEKQQAKPQVDAQSEHEDHILGVRVGMSVPEALKAVFEYTATSPAPQKPDALKEDGKDKKDIRVAYKNLKEGELQIVFAGGRQGLVREITLIYAKQPTMSDLKLPPTGSINVMTVRNDALENVLNEGQVYDTRYSVGFTDEQKTERYWWRDERTPGGYSIRVGFISKKITGKTFQVDRTVLARKVVMVKPGDEKKFMEIVAPQ
jgi:hypothetical protein